MPEYPLGRVALPPDPRDRNFPMALALPAVTAPKSRSWRTIAPILNQGNVGACVGFTGAAWMGAAPLSSRLITSQTGFDLYAECKRIDGYAGEGTYSRALAKVLQAQGRLESYLWAQTPFELKAWVLTKGTVWVGTNWYEGMFDPSADGYPPITGNLVGGHEYLVRGYNAPKDAYRCRNSWGRDWGLNGEFWMSREALERLIFTEGGDAVAAVEKRP